MQLEDALYCGIVRKMTRNKLKMQHPAPPPCSSALPSALNVSAYQAARQQWLVLQMLYSGRALSDETVAVRFGQSQGVVVTLESHDIKGRADDHGGGAAARSAAHTPATSERDFGFSDFAGFLLFLQLSCHIFSFGTELFKLFDDEEGPTCRNSPKHHGHKSKPQQQQQRCSSNNHSSSSSAAATAAAAAAAAAVALQSNNNHSCSSSRSSSSSVSSSISVK